MTYIDRDKLNRAFTALRFNDDGTLRHWGDRPQWCMNGQEVEDLINSVPTADVHEVKPGRWMLVKGSDGKDYHKCSECLHTQEITGVKNYCAVCGTRMKSREDSSHPFADSVMMGREERSEDHDGQLDKQSGYQTADD